jgi:hypothetical protein
MHASKFVEEKWKNAFSVKCQSMEIAVSCDLPPCDVAKFTAVERERAASVLRAERTSNRLHGITLHRWQSTHSTYVPTSNEGDHVLKKTATRLYTRDAFPSLRYCGKQPQTKILQMLTIILFKIFCLPFV